MAVFGREVQLTVALPVGRVDLARDNGELVLGCARCPRRQGFVAEKPVPGPPRVAEGAGSEEGVELIVRVETPQRVFLTPDVEVGACWRKGVRVSLMCKSWERVSQVDFGLLVSRKFIRK